ncbi:MAG: aminopeptidase P N-terminal domain-containing protein [Candidatus Saccharimonadales bacterium]
MVMSREFYIENRSQLAKRLGGGVFVLTAYSKQQRTNDTSQRFEQEANFWWLTGIEAAQWQLIVDGTRNKSWLVAPHIKDINYIFDGGLSAEDAVGISGVDTVISSDEATVLLRDLAKKHIVVYAIGEHQHVEYFDFVQNPADKKLRESLTRIFATVRGCRKDITALRRIKQPEEIAALRQAIDLTIEGFELIKEKLPTLKYEYEVEAEFGYLFRRKGAFGHAYDPIVAGGLHACTLHYDTNDDTLKKRELLMLDVGARHHGYSADISRTYAVGKPTKRQIAVHAAVQAAQTEIINLLGPGVSVEEYHKRSDAIMIDALMSLDLMTNKDDTASFRKYFPHAISHGLGIDTHDGLGGPKYFEAGMVLTVEPGIYINEESIGVRIEDDILITKSGYENLSVKLSTDL